MKQGKIRPPRLRAFKACKVQGLQGAALQGTTLQCARYKPYRHYKACETYKVQALQTPKKFPLRGTC
jgi:hypothetical protein